MNRLKSLTPSLTSGRGGLARALCVTVVMFAAFPLWAVGGGDAPLPALWSCIPFVVLLLGIAFLPVIAEHWWHRNRNKLLVSLGLSLPVVVYLFSIGRGGDVIHQILLDYIPFIALLGALFYISGGIIVRGDIEATPVNNVSFLALGSILASFIGTTGASMLLIRPLISTNQERKKVVHTVVFFIFCVSNVGGLLTPLGDPPLFLGYLRGVPFEWTFSMTPQWLFTLIILLGIYYLWDMRAYASESPEDIMHDKTNITPVSVRGQRNFFILGGVILVVAFVNQNYEPFKSLIEGNEYWKLIQVPMLVGLAVFSGYVTPPEFRKENNFTAYPILEVAALFIGIFLAMIPAVILLRVQGGALGVDTAVEYFFYTGIFSSFLDNAPTYVVFLSLAQGTGSVMEVVNNQPLILKAISLGAVFMGAMTYIGNAPNFMVKAIAEQAGVKMPNFGKYMLYSIGILMPVFCLMVLIFLL